MTQTPKKNNKFNNYNIYEDINLIIKFNLSKVIIFFRIPNDNTNQRITTFDTLKDYKTVKDYIILTVNYNEVVPIHIQDSLYGTLSTFIKFS